MSESWFLGIVMRRFATFLRQKLGAFPRAVYTLQQQQSEGMDITKVTFLMLAVIVMCATSWGPLINRKPLNGRLNNQQGPAQE